MKSLRNACSIVTMLVVITLVGCKGGGSGASASGTISGIDTPSSISVVSANNAN